MCVAVTGKVLSVNKGRAMIDIKGIQKEVSVELVGGVSVGEYVLVHAGCAIQKLEENEAIEIETLFREIEETIGQING